MLSTAPYTGAQIQASEKLSDSISRTPESSSKLTKALIAGTVVGVALSALVGIPAFFSFGANMSWW
jgi:F0F1-type ATP synthase assembly protein I